MRHLSHSRVNFLIKIQTRCWNINQIRHGITFSAAPCIMYVIVVYYVLHAHCHVQVKTTYLLTCLLTSYLYLYNMNSLPKNLKQVYDTRELRRRPKLTGAPFVYYLVGRATAAPPMSAQSFTFRSRLKTELFKLSWFCSCATTRLISPVHHMQIATISQIGRASCR